MSEKKIAVKKLHGELPATVVVLHHPVDFDRDGNAEVIAEVADVLAQIPGYSVEPAEEDIEGEDGEGGDEGLEAPSEDEIVEKKAPQKKKPPVAPKK